MGKYLLISITVVAELPLKNASDGWETYLRKVASKLSRARIDEAALSRILREAFGQEVLDLVRIDTTEELSEITGRGRITTVTIANVRCLVVMDERKVYFCIT